ncbi:MAG: 3-oxoacyl-[acyl-carrier-protein] reductase FabG [Holosporales bacterium]
MEKLALVTGGTRGIGAAIAKRLKNDGYRVLATYVSNTQAAQNFEQETGIKTIQWDVSSKMDMEKNAQRILEEFKNMSVIVHNAGITSDSFFHKMTSDQWENVLSTNLSSCFYVIHPFIERMRQQQYGRILLISSINGLKGQMGQTNYAAAKAGLIGFTKSLALENANKGITVNAIAPGYIETDMVKAIDPAIADKIKQQIPVGRFGTADEIAACAAFLCNDLSGFITGETLNINGGQYLS